MQGGAGESWGGRAALVAGEAAALRAAAGALQARHAGGALCAEWHAAAAAAPCPGDLRLHVKARTLVERLRDSWQHLVRDRATRSLTYNDEQFHVLERITVAETGRRARSLLMRAAPLTRARADAIADWSVPPAPPPSALRPPHPPPLQSPLPAGTRWRRPCTCRRRSSTKTCPVLSSSCSRWRRDCRTPSSTSETASTTRKPRYRTVSTDFHFFQTSSYTLCDSSFLIHN